MIKLVHLNEHSCDIKICRGTPYGNPFTHKKGSTKAKWRVKTRAESIARFKVWLLTSNDHDAVWIRENMHELKDQTLGCYCHTDTNPKQCHGEVYAELLDESPLEDFFA